VPSLDGCDELPSLVGGVRLLDHPVVDLRVELAPAGTDHGGDPSRCRRVVREAFLELGFDALLGGVKGAQRREGRGDTRDRVLPARPGGPGGPRVGAAGKHDLSGTHLARRSRQPKAIRARSQAGYRHALVNRRGERASVGLQVAHDLVPRREAVGLIAGIGGAGEADGPVGGVQEKAVPAGAPALPDPAPLQDDVVDPEPGELMADGEAGLAGPDYDDLPLAQGGRC